MSKIGRIGNPADHIGAVPKPERLSHSDDSRFPIEAQKGDAEALARLIGEKARPTSAYFAGAPLWSEEARIRLYNFVAYALEQNKLFKDKPLATQECIKRVCEAIMGSPQLTAKFFPVITSKQ